MAEKKEAKKTQNPQSQDGAENQPAASAKDPVAKKNTPAKTAAKKDPVAKKNTPAKDAGKKDADAGEAENESYLKDLMSISGHGGLFRFVSQGRNGIIVESLETGKRMQAFSSMKVSALEDIAVYTNDEEMKLEEVFSAIHKYESGKETISPKSEADDLKDYFSAVLPEYDREKVYVSDIKKILGWYNLLLEHNLLEVEKTARKSQEPKSESKAEHSHAPVKPATRTPVRKETGAVHSRAETRGPAKMKTAGGKKSPSRGD